MDDRLLHPDFPHHRPQNGARRQTLNLTMFSDLPSRGRRTTACSGRSNRADVAERASATAGVERPSRASDRSLRFETVVEGLSRARWTMAKRVAAIGGLDLRRRMADRRRTIYDLHADLATSGPAWRCWSTRRRRLGRRASVDDVEFEPYDGPVYDLEVDVTHNYVANGVLVHNSVYRFRGADFRNILEFEEAFPDVTTVVLDQNYRSTQTILDAANAVIDNNAERKPKSLWTDAGRRRRASCATTPRTRATRPVGRRHGSRSSTTTTPPLARDGRLLPHQRPEPR